MITEMDMQHGMLRAGEDVTGWIGSEKFRGCRGFWDGFNLWTRGGLRVDIPPHWRDELPEGFPLDGEVYCGPDGEALATDFVRFGRFVDGMTFMVFDAPEAGGNYLERLATARGRLEACGTGVEIQVVETRVLESTAAAIEWMLEIQKRGGEGLVARKNGLPYKAGRTSKILKMKEPDTEEITAADVDALLEALENGEVCIEA